MEFAPVVLFAYNRPLHLKETVNSLLKNELSVKSYLYIYSDGPKTEKEMENVKAVRKFIKTIKGFKSVEIFEQEKNIGLASSIINGVTDITRLHGQAVVLEDDLTFSEFFLNYMNEALKFYQDEMDVVCISGYQLPLKAKKLPETCFLSFGESWGWATWKRGWDIFERDGKKLLQEIRSSNLSEEFDFSGNYPFTEMLEKQTLGINDSWAIRWCASIFLRKKLMLVPGKSLIRNTGNDGTGTHSKKSMKLDSEICNNPVKIEKIPLIKSRQLYEAISDYYFKTFRKEKNG